ncbi:MAG: CPCC family cysteine-rich protein [Opitutaceae bacterium]
MIRLILIVPILFLMACSKQNDQATWYEPEDPTPREQCPCCDYISLPERGNYLICKVCFWEDDGQDIDELDVGSGPNHGITLREGRMNFKEFGACEKKMLPHVVSKEERKEYAYRPRDTEK